MQPYIAHVDQKSGRTQSMTEHAENVAELSARFAAPLCLAQTARLIALVHDMGKGTSARPDGSMEVVQLVWWTHNCANGQYSSARVHRSLHVTTGEDGMPILTVDESAIEGLAYEQLDGE